MELNERSRGHGATSAVPDTLDTVGQQSVLHALGTSLSALGQSSEAAAAWEHGVALGGPRFELHASLAGHWAEAGEPARAERHFSAALELAPGSAEVLNNAGFFHERQGRLDVAVAHYREAIRIAPGHPQIATNLRNAEQRFQFPAQS